MKRLHFVATLCLVAIIGTNATYAQCRGLKNPTQLRLYNNSATGKFQGFTGSKDDRASNCSALGMTFDMNAPISADQLESQQSGSSCTSSASTNINGVSDTYHRFVIKGSGTDPLTYNHLTYLPPDPAYTSSIRLGNNCGGTHEAEMLTYEFDVEPENSLVTIWFALSLQNGQHNVSQNPEFAIQVEELRNGQWQRVRGDTLCYTRPTPAGQVADITPFYFGSTGQHTTTAQPSSTYGNNIYLDWNKVVINLYSLLSHHVRIKIAAGDCSMSAHYACCYIAGDCQPMRLSASGCAAGATENVGTIKAPKGLQTYRWYKSRTGLTNSTNIADYELISGADDSTLGVLAEHFIINNGGRRDTLAQQTFLCQMTSYMNPAIPITSVLITDVGNKKPTLMLDSVMYCNSKVELQDNSFTRYVQNQATDNVNHNITEWTYYASSTPTTTPVHTEVGQTSSYTFAQGGNYCVKMRVSAYDTTCWNEKVVHIHALQTPQPTIRLSDQDICAGDTIILSDPNAGSVYHKWIIHTTDSIDTIVSPSVAQRYTFFGNTRVELIMRNSTFSLRDTNNDGIDDMVYCFGHTDTVVRVGQYPKLQVFGDTIVCNGDRSDVWVQSDVENCTFDWYEVKYGTTPYVANNSHLITTISQDRRFYVKVTSPNGCDSWDSVNLYLVRPSLNISKDKMCTGDTVKLWAGKAAYYEWTTSVFDPTIVGQESRDTITVSPNQTTVYTVVGHGTNGCTTSPLTQRVQVFPYPIMGVNLTPGYIDSDNPTVQFTDISEYGTSSLWEFGNGETSTIRSVVHTFTDLSKDSIEIKLTTGNALNCKHDTSFFIPVGIFTVWFPNAFTPKLETNQYFKAFTANELLDFNLYIYDRRGNMVFQSHDQEQAWDGTVNGNDCPEGAYVYIATYRRDGADRLISQKGTVMLLR